LLRAHKVVGGQVDNFTDLELIDEGLHEPKGGDVRRKIDQAFLLVVISGQGKNFDLLAGSVSFALRKILNLAKVAEDLIGLIHSLIVQMLTQATRVIHHVLKNLQRILVNLKK
jgi:hypothetical protein